MKNIILFLFGFFAFSLSILAQGNFSYKRQLSYKQCEKCNCKKSRSYKIISTNLSSFQRNCAQEDINADLTVKEMFQNGTSGGGLFAGFNLPQEGCGNDCYHEFQNTSDNVETVQVDDCFTEAQKQKNNQEKINEQRNKEAEEARIASERIKLKEFLKKKDQEIDILRKDAKNLYDINDLKSCLIIQEKVCTQSAELQNLYEKNDYRYYANIFDVNNYAWYLILNKEYDKALNKLNEFFKLDFGKFTAEELEKFHNVLWYSTLGEPIGELMSVNFSHALLLSNKNEKLYRCIIYLQFDSDYSYEKQKSWGKMILEGYRLLEEKGIEIPNGQNLKYSLKLMSQSVNVAISTNSKVSFKNYFQNFKDDFEKELCRTRGEIVKMDENLFRIVYVCSNCSGSFSRNIYYYLDFNGNPIIVYDCPRVSWWDGSPVSSKKETKIIVKAKQIRDKDLGVASPKN
jgi:hypothetical protein